MKKFFVLCMALAAGFAARAQHNVGDLVDNDGVRAIVIHVSDEGRALLLKLAENAADNGTYKALKAANEKTKRFMDSMNMDKKQYKEYVEKLKEDRKAYMLEVSDRLGESGARNMEAIEEFCNEKGIDMDKYFPDIAHAKKIGEGWFLPGDAELALIHEFLNGGIGKDCKVKGGDLKKLVKETIQSTPGFGDCGIPGAALGFNPPSGYKSSTWSTSYEHKKEKFNGVMPHCTVLHQPKMGGAYYEFQDENVETRGTGAVTVFIKETTSLYDVWCGRASAYVFEL